MGSSAWRSTSSRAARRPPAARKALLDAFARRPTTGRGRRSPPAATDQAPTYVTGALAYERPPALTDFVAGCAPAAAARRAPAGCSCCGRAAPAAGVGAQGGGRPGHRADGGRPIAPGRGDDRSPADAAGRSGDDGGGAADRREVGQVRARCSASAERQAGRPACASSTNRQAERRSPRRPRREPAGRSAAPAAGARDDRPLLADAAVSAPLKARADRRARRERRRRRRRRVIAALARTSSTPIFDQILKRPDASLALLAAMKDGRSRRQPRPRQRRAAAHASEPAGRAPGGRAPRHAQPGRQGEERHHRRAPAGGREARRRRRRARRSSPAPARAVTSSATSARATSGRR